MQENSNIVYLDDYRKAKPEKNALLKKADAEKIAFCRGLEYDAIDATLQKMGRGPIMPSENVLTVLSGQKISLATIGSLPTMKMAVENSRFDLMTLVTDILHDLKHPEYFGVPTDERGKIMVKKNGSIPSQSPEQTLPPFIKQDIQEQQSNVISLSDYLKGTPEIKQETQQNNNVVSFADYKMNKEQQTNNRNSTQHFQNDTNANRPAA